MKAPDGFEVFWQAYPRHDGERVARRVWTALKLDPATQAAVQCALVWQRREWSAIDPRYVPMAKNYLRGERWTDEPDRANSLNSSQEVTRHNAGLFTWESPPSGRVLAFGRTRG